MKAETVGSGYNRMHANIYEPDDLRFWVEQKALGAFVLS